MTATVDVRGRLQDLVREYPGLHVRDLARRLDTSVRIVEYHARALLDEEQMEERRQGAYQRLYPSHEELPLRDRDRDALGILRKPIPLGIVLALLDAPDGLTHGELCRRVGASKSNASHHLKDLQTAGLVLHRDDAFHVARAEHVRALIAAHKPVPDLRARFGEAWASFYQR